MCGSIEASFFLVVLHNKPELQSIQVFIFLFAPTSTTNPFIQYKTLLTCLLCCVGSQQQNGTVSVSGANVNSISCETYEGSDGWKLRKRNATRRRNVSEMITFGAQ